MNCPNCDHSHSPFRHGLSPLRQGYVCRGCGSWLYCNSPDFRKKMFRADVRFAISAFFLCSFALVLFPPIWIVLAILATMILIHLAFIASFCKQCELVAGRWKVSPWRLSYFAVGVGFMFLSLASFFAFVFLVETESDSVRMLIWVLMFLSLRSFMPIGLSLVLFSIVCAVVTRITDFYARWSSKNSQESVE